MTSYARGKRSRIEKKKDLYWGDRDQGCEGETAGVGVLGGTIPKNSGGPGGGVKTRENKNGGDKRGKPSVRLRGNALLYY